MPTLAETLSQARTFHRGGHLPDAAALYRQVLAADPSHVEAHYLLGVACHALGQSNEAVASLEQALRLQPRFVEAHSYLGVVLAQQGLLDDAIASFQQALRLRPDSAEISNNLRHALAVMDNNRANALAAQGKLDEAAAVYQRALVLKPDFAEAHNNLGTALAKQDKLDEAAACFQRALELNSDYANAHYNLGAVLAKQERLDEAAVSCRRALDLNSDFADVHNTLAAILRNQNKLDESAACCRRALELKPDFAEAYGNLGAALAKQEQFDEAIAHCRRALELRPDFAETYMNLGIVLSDQGAFDEASVCWRRALELKPDYADVHHNQGVVLMAQGQVDEALACFWKALATRPQFAAAHSGALLALQYQPGVTPDQLAAAHGAYDDRHAAPLRTTWRPHDNERDPERKLRLGFVSPDLSFHPVGYFLVRVLENLDKHQAHSTCYCDRFKADTMTGRLRAAATAWRDVRVLNDQQLADQIRADRIDIVFDLAGHTGSNRLLSFARKPAPIAITWLGYVGTTGLAAMDYLLADRYEVPETAEPYVLERVLRMPDSYVCYDPPRDAPSVSPLPALARGYVTFGSFNNPAKITADVVDAWTRILRQVTGSRLVLKYRWMDVPSVASRIEEMFAERGIDSARLELLGGSYHEDFLRAYQRIDVGLDPFPYSGGLTTCEALWMGVPVVTCPGETFASRHALSHLSNVGLTETIANDLDGYVLLAAGLAADLPRLAVIRGRLRQQVAASPLCDGQRFAEHFMKLLRGAWREWCDSQKA